MSQPVIVIGASGNCLEVVEAMHEHNRVVGKQEWNPLGYLDDNLAHPFKCFWGLPILGPISKAKDFPEAKFVLGIGSPTSFLLRQKIFESLDLGHSQFATVIHPSAVVSPSASLGFGTVLLAHVTVGANARLGHHVTVLPNSVVSHDAQIGHFSILASSVVVSGNVVVGTNTYLGAQSCVREGLRIGHHALVGMGSVVVKDIDHSSRVWGNPARPRP